MVHWEFQSSQHPFEPWVFLMISIFASSVCVCVCKAWIFNIGLATLEKEGHVPGKTMVIGFQVATKTDVIQYMYIFLPAWL